MSLSALVLGMLVALPVGEGINDATISMQLTPDYSAKGGSLLKVILTLESATPVLVSPRDLPWGSPYNALVLVAAPAPGHGEVLPRAFPFDEPMDPPPNLQLQPGKPVGGEVYLSSRFHGDKVERALAGGDLIVFWSFRLELSDGRFSNRVGGWVLASGPPRKR
jgi:hypothetical protein